VSQVQRRAGALNMNTILVAALVTASVVAPCATAPAAAQPSRQAIVADQQLQKAESPPPQSRPLGRRIVRMVDRIFNATPPAIVPTMGGVRRGSGLAPGAALLAPAGRGLLTTRAVWSVRNTKRLEASLELPPEVLGPRIMLDGYWEDAANTYWFGLGPQSSEARQEYGLTTREISAAAQMVVRGPFHVTARGGYVDSHATSIGESAWFESGVAAFLDTRTSPGYTRRGGLYHVGVDYYAAQTAGQSGFFRFTVDARQFIPLVHENWVLAGQVRAELTERADDAPYFMLPYLGGGSSLRGYSTYRFVDRQAVLARGELRWMASSTLEISVFGDTGVVGPTVRDMRFGRRSTGYGMGARFHGPTFTAFRMDVAHGAEGWHLHFGQHVSF
jgi:hypothetical protein